MNNIDYINKQRMNLMCRTCMQINKRLVNILEYKEKGKLLSDMLFECTSLKIQKNDGLPLHMCSDCLERLISAWDFRVMVNEIHSKLHTIISRSVRENLLQHSKYIDMTIVKEETTVIKSEMCNLSVQENVDNNSNFKLCTYVKNISDTDKVLDQLDTSTDENSNNETNIINTIEENSEDKEKNPLVNNNPANTIIKKLCKILLKDNSKNNSEEKLTDNLISEDNIPYNTYSENEIENCIIGAEELLKCPKGKENDTLSINKENQNNLPSLLNMNECSNEGQGCNVNNADCNIQNNVKEDEPKQNQLQGNQSDNLDGILLTDNSQNNIVRFTDIFDSQDNDKKYSELLAQNRNKKFTRKERRKMFVFCRLCNKSFKYRTYTERHIFLHKRDKLMKCNICNKSFVTQRELDSHKVVHSEEKSFSCKICGKSFKRLNSLTKHSTTHLDIAPSKCNLCGKTYKTKEVLKLHLRRHEENTDHLCEICGKLFASFSNLYKHKYVHVDEKKHTCSVCEKIFTTRHDMLQHMRTHSDKRPYKCNNCDKCFKTKNVMQKHSLIHTDEKPYSCRICGKLFKQSASLHNHMRVHTGETPYPCKLCPNRFKYSHHLQNHMRSHN